MSDLPKKKKIVLEQDQLDAITFLEDSILDENIKVVALLGAGGTGKTAILHKLAMSERLKETPLTFTATTNKAAGIMRKDIEGAVTMHSAISKYNPTKLFIEIDAFINQETESISEPFSQSTLSFLGERNIEEDDLFNYSDGRDFFNSIGIDGYDPLVFSHYSTATYEGGVCVVDESSMLPTLSIYDKYNKLQTIGLDSITPIYDTVVLVGDDSQLPPINGESSFEGVPSYHLTKNHRAEKDLLRLLDYARNGGCLETFETQSGENIRVVRELEDRYIKASRDLDLDLVHIVYKNVTRKKITLKVRGTNGMPQEGERIVYCGKNINDPGDMIAKNEIGVFKDGMGEWENHNEFIDFKKFDEYPVKGTWSKYRYGYAMTCHTAQGSSFDHVIVHVGDMPGFIDRETQRKWLYTAVSRARKSVIIVR